MKYAEQVRKLDWYDEGLKTILDIRCSRLRPRKGRHQLETDVMASLSMEHTLPKDVNIFFGVKDAIDHDHLFCGTNRENNGKFRQVYMQLYRQKLELVKQRAILERLREKLKEDQ